jgi:hypothetical protein
MLEFWDGTRKSDKDQLLTRTCTKPNIRWLVHNWNTFGVKMSHRQSWTHKTHHLGLGSHLFVDSNSQGGTSLGNVKVHSLTLSYIFGSM